MNISKKQSIKLKSLAAGSMLALVVSVSTADASRMEKLFDSYSVGSAYSGQTNDGMRWTGGSFRGRWRQPDIEVFSFQPPSLSSGCGGLDVFGGAFGLVSGDQLVQVARGLAQGAAIYLFKLSVNTICSSCSAIMANVQETLEKLNALARNSCQNTLTALETRYPFDPKDGPDYMNELASVTAGWADELGELNLAESTLDGFGLKGVSNTAKSNAANANAVYQALERSQINHLGLVHSFAMEFGISTNSQREKLASFLMTMIGTEISLALSPGETCGGVPYNPADEKSFHCVSYKSPTLNFDALITGAGADDQGSVEFKEFSCSNSSTLPAERLNKCVDLIEETEYVINFKDFATLVLKGATAGDGLFDRLWRKATLSPSQLKFLELMPLPHVRIKQAIDSYGLSNEMFEEYYIALFTYTVAVNLQQTIALIYNDISNQAAGDGKTVKLVDAFKERYKSFMIDADRTIKSVESDLRSQENKMKVGLKLVEIRKLVQAGA